MKGWHSYKMLGTNPLVFYSCEGPGCDQIIDNQEIHFGGGPILCPRHERKGVEGMQSGNKSGLRSEGHDPVVQTDLQDSDPLSFNSIPAIEVNPKSVYLNGPFASPAPIRKFETGATRDTDNGKYDYEGFLSPLVLERFGKFMHKNRIQKDGSYRDSDNWTKGIPQRVYLKSLWRHFLDVCLILRGWGQKATTQDLEEALCACLFNAQGLLHEILLGRDCGKDSPTKVGS